MLPTRRATRIVSAIRAGSSLPVVVETEDMQRWLVKLRGAGGGVRSLAADAVYGAFADALGIPVPKRAVVELPADIASDARHEEVLELLTKSTGRNLGFAFLDDARPYVHGRSAPPSVELASRVLALDLLLLNVDRTEANPNVLLHGKAEHAFVDHGSLLLFEHALADAGIETDISPLAAHVLRTRAGRFGAEALRMVFVLSDSAIDGALADLPADWLGTDPENERRRMRELVRTRRDRTAWRHAAQERLTFSA